MDLTPTTFPLWILTWIEVGPSHTAPEAGLKLSDGRKGLGRLAMDLLDGVLEQLNNPVSSIPYEVSKTLGLILHGRP